MRSAAEEIAAALSDHVENVILFEAVDSTHNVALRLIEQMDSEGLRLRPTLLWALAQSRGRGRGERTWSSPAGGLYVNWIASAIPIETVSLLPILAAAAAHAAVSSLGIEDVAIKWPNDILVDGEKVAGIVVHARHGEVGWATVGIGVNVATAPALEDPGALPATCIAAHVAPRDWEACRLRTAVNIVGGFARSLTHPEAAVDAWRGHMAHRPGEPLTVRLGSGELAHGTYSGLTPEGFLELRQGDEIKVVSSGDVIGDL